MSDVPLFLLDYTLRVRMPEGFSALSKIVYDSVNSDIEGRCEDGEGGRVR